MKKIILLVLPFILLTINNSYAKVNRGTFTSDGDYIQHHERNDYKKPDRSNWE